jgi:hypothetical protein
MRTDHSLSSEDNLIDDSESTVVSKMSKALAKKVTQRLEVVEEENEGNEDEAARFELEEKKGDFNHTNEPFIEIPDEEGVKTEDELSNLSNPFKK